MPGVWRVKMMFGVLFHTVHEMGVCGRERSMRTTADCRRCVNGLSHRSHVHMRARMSQEQRILAWDCDEKSRDQPEIRTPPMISTPHPGLHPGHHGGRGRPGVCPTPGITAAGRARGAPITVMPGVGTTPPRARATV